MFDSKDCILSDGDDAADGMEYPCEALNSNDAGECGWEVLESDT